MNWDIYIHPVIWNKLLSIYLFVVHLNIIVNSYIVIKYFLIEDHVLIQELFKNRLILETQKHTELKSLPTEWVISTNFLNALKKIALTSDSLGIQYSIHACCLEIDITAVYKLKTSYFREFALNWIISWTVRCCSEFRSLLRP